MSSSRVRHRARKAVVAAAVALGVATGSYGVASAAGGSDTTTSSGDSTRSAPSAQHPWGGQRSDETLLTGETATKVRQLALSEVEGATVVRVETDADGHAAYEAHLVKADGIPVTVYVDAQFNVVDVVSR